MAIISSSPEKTFKLFWKDGKVELIRGFTIAKAFTKAGYGRGAVKQLGRWEEVKGI